MLELDEALSSELVREREMVVEIEQPGVERPCASSACRSSSRARPASTRRLPGPALGEHTEEALLAAGYSAAEVAELLAGRRRSGAGRGRPGRHHPGLAGGRGQMATNARGPTALALQDAGEPALLKMSELAERSGVSAGTIRYYLREGLLGDGEDIVRTSRNMAYYPPGYVQRIELIKRLQEERFMPLRVIKGALREDPDRVHALIELEDRILERALAGAEERSRVSTQRGGRALRRAAQRARAPRRDRRADPQPARL